MKTADIRSADVPAVCRFLRTRQIAATVTADGVLPWEAGENAAAAYWCVATSGPVGPDDAIVHAKQCVNRRICFRARA